MAGMPHAEFLMLDFDGFPIVVACFLLFGGIALYFLPSIVARSRRVQSPNGIIVLNVFLGWTGVGWLGALVWACAAETESQVQMRELLARHLLATTTPSPPSPAAAPRPQEAGAYSVGRLAGSAFASKAGDDGDPISLNLNR
jgi:hypothetical protein